MVDTNPLCHLGLVRQFIARLRLPPWIDRDDLAQEGYFGLRAASERFDPTRRHPKTGKPLKFSTYAFWHIRRAIIGALRGYGRQLFAVIDQEALADVFDEPRAIPPDPDDFDALAEAVVRSYPASSWRRDPKATARMAVQELRPDAADLKEAVEAIRLALVRLDTLMEARQAPEAEKRPQREERDLWGEGHAFGE